MNSISNLIYFNNNRTTRIDPEVVESMDVFNTLSEDFQQKELAAALQHICRLINCEPSELIITKGTTESVYLALQSAFELNKHKGRHIITNKTEHFAVLDCLEELKKEGTEISYLDVDREGLIDVESLKKAIRNDTVLVSIMAANNETGVIQPLESIAEICTERDILFFSDASQYVGKMRCDSKELGLDCMAFGAHKMYGPEGVGALYVKEKHGALKNIVDKNHHHSISPHLIVGFGKAAEIHHNTQWDMSVHLSKLKNYFEHQLLDIEGLRINGSTRHRLYNTSNLSFPESKNISALLDRFDFAENIKKPSYVLKAMRLGDEEIKNSYRFSFGKYNTLEEVKLLVDEILNKI